MSFWPLCRNPQVHAILTEYGYLKYSFRQGSSGPYSTRLSDSMSGSVDGRVDHLCVAGSHTGRVAEQPLKFKSLCDSAGVTEDGRLFCWAGMAADAAAYATGASKGIAGGRLPSGKYVAFDRNSDGGFGVFQIGTDSDWESVSGTADGICLALKTNGGLWSFGSWQSGVNWKADLAVPYAPHPRLDYFSENRGLSTIPFRMILSSAIVGARESSSDLAYESLSFARISGNFGVLPVWFTKKPTSCRVMKTRWERGPSNAVPYSSYQVSQEASEPGQGASVSVDYLAAIDTGAIRRVDLGSANPFADLSPSLFSFFDEDRFISFEGADGTGSGAVAVVRASSRAATSTSPVQSVKSDVVILNPGDGYKHPVKAFLMPRFASQSAVEVPGFSVPAPRRLLLTSGGAYRGVPLVSFSPGEGEVNDPAVDAAAAAVTRMSKVSIASFLVTSGGSGYSFAYATENKTGATATAVIRDGSVVGWTITSEGSDVHSPLDTDALSVVISGDGIGANAEALPKPSAVEEVSMTRNPPVWSVPPVVSFIGGNGAGASAVVQGIIGKAVAKINSGGSGYTKTQTSRTLWSDGDRPNARLSFPGGFEPLFRQADFCPFLAATPDGDEVVGGRSVNGESLVAELLLAPSFVSEMRENAAGFLNRQAATAEAAGRPSLPPSGEPYYITPRDGDWTREPWETFAKNHEHFKSLRAACEDYVSREGTTYPFDYTTPASIQSVSLRRGNFSLGLSLVGTTGSEKTWRLETEIPSFFDLYEDEGGYRGAAPGWWNCGEPQRVYFLCPPGEGEDVRYQGKYVVVDGAIRLTFARTRQGGRYVEEPPIEIMDRGDPEPRPVTFWDNDLATVTSFGISVLPGTVTRERRANEPFGSFGEAGLGVAAYAVRGGKLHAWGECGLRNVPNAPGLTSNFLLSDYPTPQQAWSHRTSGGRGVSDVVAQPMLVGKGLEFVASGFHSSLSHRLNAPVDAPEVPLPAFGNRQAFSFLEPVPKYTAGLGYDSTFVPWSHTYESQVNNQTVTITARLSHRPDIARVSNEGLLLESDGTWRTGVPFGRNNYRHSALTTTSDEKSGSGNTRPEYPPPLLKSRYLFIKSGGSGYAGSGTTTQWSALGVGVTRLSLQRAGASPVERLVYSFGEKGLPVGLAIASDREQDRQLVVDGGSGAGAIIDYVAREESDFEYFRKVFEFSDIPLNSQIPPIHAGQRVAAVSADGKLVVGSYLGGVYEIGLLGGYPVTGIRRLPESRLSFALPWFQGWDDRNLFDGAQFRHNFFVVARNSIGELYAVAIGLRGYAFTGAAGTAPSSTSMATRFFANVGGENEIPRPYLLCPFALALTSLGGPEGQDGTGYDYPVTVSVTQPDGVAKGTATIDGKVVAIGVADGGSGYRSPPPVTFSAGGCSAVAEISGPVVEISVTNSGSQYRSPPRVRFEGPGIPAVASATLSPSGGISSVQILSGGTYRVAPSISFEPTGHVESVSVDAAGSGYTFSPAVTLEGGGGTGAAAVAVLSPIGGISHFVVTNHGSGYDRPPRVIVTGGGGTGARGIAEIAYSGSGAQATAAIEGSVVKVRVTSPGSGLQKPPKVFCNHPTGEGNGRKNAILKAAILGRPTSVNVESGGSNYCKPLFESQRFRGMSELVRRPTVYASGSFEQSNIYLSSTSAAGTGELWATGIGTYPNDTYDQETQFGPRSRCQNNPSHKDAIGTPRAQFSNLLGIAEIAAVGDTGRGSVSGVILPQCQISLTQTKTGSAVSPYATYALTRQGDLQLDGRFRLFHSESSSAPVNLPTRYSDRVLAGPDGAIVGVVRQSHQTINDYNLGTPRALIDGPFCVTSPATFSSFGGQEFTSELGHPLNCYYAPQVLFDGHIEVTATVTATYAGLAVEPGPIPVPYALSGGGPKKPYLRAAHQLHLLGRSSLAIERGDGDFIDASLAGSVNVPAEPDISICASGQVAGFVPVLPISDWSEDDLKFSEKAIGFYSQPPTLVVEDETGEGCAIEGLQAGRLTPLSFANAAVASGGANYTLGARMRLRGGRPLAWDSPAQATAVIQGGVVVSISLSSGGQGYTKPPLVFIAGDGGGASAAVDVSDINSQTGAINRIRLTSAGSGYTAASVVIVDQEQDSSQSHALHEFWDRMYSVVLENANADRAVLSPRGRRKVTFGSVLGGATTMQAPFTGRLTPFLEGFSGRTSDGKYSFLRSGYPTSLAFCLQASGARFHDIFFSDGFVSGIHLAGHYGERPSGPITVTITPNSEYEPDNPATATATRVYVDNVFSGTVANVIQGGKDFPAYQHNANG